MPAEAARDREVLRYYGVKTTLTLPLSAGGGPAVGAVSFNDMQRERTWPGPLVKRLQLVAQVFANALARKASEEALRESEERLNLAAEAAGAGLWIMTLVTEQVWTTPRLRSLFQFSPEEELTFQRFLEVIHPADRELVRRGVTAAIDAATPLNVEYRLALPDGTVRWVNSRGRAQASPSGKPHRVMGVSLDITKRKRTEAALRDLSGRLLNAQEEERTRVAKELHDGISQNLALLAVELDLLGQRPPEAAAQVKARMEEFSTRTKTLLEEVHRLSRALHPAKLEQLGLTVAMRSFCREMEAGGVIAVQFEAHDVPRSLPDELALCLYRVAQEALWNVAKHSGAKRATVELAAADGGINLSIADEGKGFDPEVAPPATSLGLVSMRERIRLVQGEIRWDSKPGQGTKVSVQVPLKG
jgi:PAS domain S-box-containing protein